MFSTNLLIFAGLFALVITSNAQTTPTTDPCAGKLDGTYCLNNFAYTCAFGRMTAVQTCTYCIQSTAYTASCSSYIVPTDFCSLRISGFYCYRPIGSSIQTSIQCDYQQIFQQNTCAGDCDVNTGQCAATTAVGTTPAPCSISCKYGCTIYGDCKTAPFCSDSTQLDITDTPFCSAYLTPRNVASQLNLYAQDSDARGQFKTISTWGNITYSDSCQTSMKRFICESKFKNCAEKSGYQTCKTTCQNTIKCMETELSTVTSGIISPINCKLECNSASLYHLSFLGLMIILLAVFL